MHRRRYAICTLKLQITAKSPLLVQGAQATAGTATFYEAHDPVDNKKKYCIPASSLKGVWRSTVESILRTFDPQLACDPFCEEAGVNQSCSKRLERQGAAEFAYAASCPACRLFGSTAHAGLVQVQDAWATSNPIPFSYTGIAIDRFTGGAKAHALYKQAALPTSTTFTTSITLENFEFWQLGLLALVCREMSEGRVRLGSGARRGRGHVEISWQQAEIRYPSVLYAAAVQDKHEKLASTQALAVAQDQLAYPQTEEWLLPDVKAVEPQHWSEQWWTRLILDKATLATLQIACVEQALRPKLEAGLRGFAYSPTTEEATHA